MQITESRKTIATLGATLVLLLALVFLGTRQYGGNVSALLHMDVPFGQEHYVPPGVILYQDAAYDGMLYYQITRDLPDFFTGQPTSLTSAYRFQRILLPILTYVTTLGHEPAFPLAMLGINILVTLLSVWLILRLTDGRTLHALTIVLNPATLVGVLYMLTEPLSLFFIVVFFTMWFRRNQRLDILTISLLLLSLLARETTIFLIALLFLWFLWQKQWRNAALILLPIIPFLAWQVYLDQYFGSVAFQANSNTVSPPFSGPLTLLQWLTEGITTYRLSGLAMLTFTLLLCGALSREWWKARMRVDLLCFLLSGLTFALVCMDAHMWGAITSIGRVVTPLYPVYALYAAKRDTWIERSISMVLMIISLVAGIGIAAVAHPYVLS